MDQPLRSWKGYMLASVSDTHWLTVLQFETPHEARDPHVKSAAQHLWLWSDDDDDPCISAHSLPSVPAVLSFFIHSIIMFYIYSLNFETHLCALLTSLRRFLPWIFCSFVVLNSFWMAKYCNINHTSTHTLPPGLLVCLPRSYYIY